MDLLPTTQKKKRCEFKPLKHSTLAQVQTLAAIFLCVLVMVAGWMHCGAWAERMSLECDAINCTLSITRGSDSVVDLQVKRERLVSAAKVRTKEGEKVDIDALTGKARRSIRGLDYSTSITYRDAAIASGETPRDCVSWHQTGNCDGYGDREADKDQSCTAQIPNGLSGYCICEGEVKLSYVSCSHEPLICQEECSGVRWNRKEQVVWMFDLGRSRQRAVTNDINWYIERQEEASLSISQSSRVTWLGVTLIVTGLFVSLLLCCFGEVIPEPPKEHRY